MQVFGICMTTIDDIVSEYQNAVNEKDWTRDFSDLVEDLEGHKYGNKLNLKNEFFEKIGIEYQHDNTTAGSLQSHAQNLLYLQSLGVTDIAKVVTRLPAIFSLSIENNLKPTVEYLEKLGVTDIGKVVTKLPPILALSIENNLQPTVDYLEKLGVTDIGKVVTKLPPILALSIEDNLQPHVDYLEELGVTDIAKVVTRLPQILALSIEDNLKPTVDYLKELGVTDIAKVVTRLPQILSYSIEDTLQPHVDYLEKLGVTDIGKVVTRHPQILGCYSIENNLKSTVEYLTNQCYATIQDIEKNPALVSYSLDKRIKPRHAFLQTKGVEVGYDITVGTMLVPNDRRFAKTAKSDYDEWMSFKEDYIQRNKK